MHPSAFHQHHRSRIAHPHGRALAKLVKRLVNLIADGAASGSKGKRGKGKAGKPAAEQEEIDSLLAELDAPKAPPPEPAGKKKKKKKGGAAAAEKAGDEDLDAILAELGGAPAATPAAAAEPTAAAQPAGKQSMPMLHNLRQNLLPENHSNALCRWRCRQWRRSPRLRRSLQASGLHCCLEDVRRSSNMHHTRPAIDD